MALDPNQPRGLEALLGRTPRSASCSDELCDVAALLRISHFTEIEQVRQAVCARELLAVNCGDAQKYPSFQFRDGKVRAGVVEVLRAAPDVEGGQILQFLQQPNDMMFGRRPIDVIGETEDRLRLVVIEAQKLMGTPGAGRPG
jgi:hypothetical protein